MFRIFSTSCWFERILFLSSLWFGKVGAPTNFSFFKLPGPDYLMPAEVFLGFKEAFEIYSVFDASFPLF